jgi:hypothetical protein
LELSCSSIGAIYIALLELSHSSIGATYIYRLSDLDFSYVELTTTVVVFLKIRIKKSMTDQELQKMKGYATVIVAELHKVIFDEAIFDAMKNVLRLAEEMECVTMTMENKRKKEGSNVVYLQRVS